ncbi:30S ribosomal protein S10 [Halobacteriales archaeon QS_4_69_34]|nr:MAG: 30S ribosomal protein S10 [Halobacteriales archaeon QS_4_69_34]
MPFVTTLRFSSGDRATLESVVGEIKRTASRKGVEFKGPHADPPSEHRAPQSKRLDADGARFPDWEYAVYVRTVAIVGHDAFARSVAEGAFPPGVHVEVEVERIRPAGRSK